MPIYCLYSPETNLLKVGWIRRDIDARQAEHQGRLGRRLQLVAAYPGDRREEAWIHRLLADYRIPGSEWFIPTRAVQSFVGTVLVAAPPEPLPAPDPRRPRRHPPPAGRASRATGPRGGPPDHQTRSPPPWDARADASATV
ncbi:MAG: GIY-YIG nuclease family protein [Singulisphaera sp.]|nr:GIY-YIG nuclease family protein [Singulisphaera sp.]